MLKTLSLLVISSAAFFDLSGVAHADDVKFHVLALHSTKAESDHILFANQAITYFKKLADDEHFDLQVSTDWSKLNPDTLKQFKVVIWLDEQTHDPAQRQAFEDYMEHGGGWIGFHVAAYNDKNTKWPWFLKFLGGGVFYNNNWPILPAKLLVDDTTHDVTKELPPSYNAPANEWYHWVPSPRENKDVHVLVTLDPSNYPLGKKDFLTEGDVPVVWTNTKYNMVYFNMGHGPHIFDNDTQSSMFKNALLWLGNKK